MGSGGDNLKLIACYAVSRSLMEKTHCRRPDACSAVGWTRCRTRRCNTMVDKMELNGGWLAMGVAIGMRPLARDDYQAPITSGKLGGRRNAHWTIMKLYTFENRK